MGAELGTTGIQGLTYYIKSATVKAIAILSGYVDSTVASASFTITTSGTPVVWIDQVGVSVEGDALIKTTATGWGNSGAASEQAFPGDGAVEFTAVGTDTYRMLGLSNSNASASYDSIGYAILTHIDGTLSVFENGADRGLFGSYQNGDVLRVERTGSTVIYKRNGGIIYTSTIPSTDPMLADAALYDPSAQLNNVRIIGLTTPASAECRSLLRTQTAAVCN